MKMFTPSLWVPKKTLPTQEDPAFWGSPPGALTQSEPSLLWNPLWNTVSHQIVFMTFMLISSPQLDYELLAGGVCTIGLFVFKRPYSDEDTAGCSGRLMGLRVFSPTLVGPPLHLFLVWNKYVGWTRVLSVGSSLDSRELGSESKGRRWSWSWVLGENKGIVDGWGVQLCRIKGITHCWGWKGSQRSACLVSSFYR